MTTHSENVTSAKGILDGVRKATRLAVHAEKTARPMTSEISALMRTVREKKMGNALL